MSKPEPPEGYESWLAFLCNYELPIGAMNKWCIKHNVSDWRPQKHATAELQAMRDERDALKVEVDRVKHLADVRLKDMRYWERKYDDLRDIAKLTSSMRDDMRVFLATAMPASWDVELLKAFRDAAKSGMLSVLKYDSLTKKPEPCNE